MALSETPTNALIELLDSVNPSELESTHPPAECDSLTKQYIYYKCLRHHVRMSSPEFLIHEPFPSIDPNLTDIITLFSSKDYCIAGGFPMKLYNNLPMIDSNGKVSDIDIPVLSSPESQERVLGDFIEKLHILDAKYTLEEITIPDLEKRSSVITCRFRTFPYPIQFILTTYANQMEVVSEFDASYVRCCFYEGQFYVAPDAKISKETKTVYFSKQSLRRRYTKTLLRGFHIFGVDPEEEKTLLDSKEEPSEWESLTIKDLFATPEKFLKFNTEWMTDYTEPGQLYAKEVNLRDYASFEPKLNCEWNGEVAHFTIPKETDITFFTIDQDVRFTYRFTFGEDLVREDYTVGHCSIVFKKKQVEEAQFIKETLLKIALKTYGLTEMPDYFKERCLDIAGREVHDHVEEYSRRQYASIQRKYPNLGVAQIPFGYFYRDFIVKANDCYYYNDITSPSGRETKLTFNLNRMLLEDGSRDMVYGSFGIWRPKWCKAA